MVLRYNEHNKLNKYVGKIVFLLCLPQPRFRHLSSPFLVSIPLVFATHYTQSLQRWWTAQEEGINEQQFLPAIPCSLLFFFLLLFSHLFLLHWCGSYRSCSTFQCVPAPAWVGHGLNSPQMHTSSCISFSVSSYASSSLSSRDLLCVSLGVSSHVTYTCISSHVSLWASSGYHCFLNMSLQRCQGLFWLVPVLVHNGSVLSIAESAGTIHGHHRAAPELLPLRSCLQLPATKNPAGYAQ